MLERLPLPEGATEITVDSIEDNDGRDDQLTLREAILLAVGELTVGALNPGEADNVVGPGGPGSHGPGADSIDVIVFDPDVFGGSDAVIELTGPLPSLATGGDIVDGGDSVVTLDGGAQENTEVGAINVGGVGAGFSISSDSNTIRGLRIYNFSEAAIAILGVDTSASENIIGPGNVISANHFAVYATGSMAAGNRIIGNFLGTDPSGTVAMGNNHGVWMTFGPHDNTIGGDSEDERNIISGNKMTGITLWSAHSNRVIGNYIGTDVTGTKSLGSPRGMRIDVGGSYNIIGGTTPGERNIFSGNSIGIEISGRVETTGNRIIGNYIGLDATGQAAVGNGVGINIEEGDDGEDVFPPGPTENVVGGLEPGERNIISGNGQAGIFIRNASSNHIVGNYIGTDPEGKRSILNGTGVILVDRAKENVVGPANVISGNLREGVIVMGIENFGNSVIGNIIGANAEDEGPLGNGQNGILIQDPSKDNVIGGSGDDGNIIAHNDGHGIMLEKTSGNAISGNSIFDNAGESIETVKRGDIGLTLFMITEMSPLLRVPPAPGA